jgi:predicted nucleotidyltransferase
MRQILRTKFGSHIYGTNLPTSDTDYKAIFIPNAKDIILQRAAQHHLNNTKTDSTKRNEATDVDDEAFSIQRYLKLLCEGQTVALDMLFTPDSFYDHQTAVWQEIKKNKDKFLHKGVSAFIGYTKQQAAKYGCKGFRVRALKEILDFLSNFMGYTKLIEIEPLDYFVSLQNPEHIKFTMCNAPNNKVEKHLDVCNRKIPLHATVKYAKEVFQKIYDEYGHRALLAEKNEGIDWKALMHAVRVAHEARELLLTSNITFPRPEKDLLLKIRTGSLPYKQVEEIIEEGLTSLVETQAKSILPEKPNYKWCDDFVLDCYYNHVIINLE